jgi:hypothetical protein
MSVGPERRRLAILAIDKAPLLHRADGGPWPTYSCNVIPPVSCLGTRFVLGHAKTTSPMRYNTLDRVVLRTSSHPLRQLGCKPITGIRISSRSSLNTSARCRRRYRVSLHLFPLLFTDLREVYTHGFFSLVWRLGHSAEGQIDVGIQHRKGGGKDTADIRQGYWTDLDGFCSMIGRLAGQRIGD